MPAAQETTNIPISFRLAEGLEVAALVGEGAFAVAQGELIPAAFAGAALAGLATWHLLRGSRVEAHDNLPPPKLPQRRRINGLWDDGFPAPPDSVIRFPPVSPRERDAETLRVVREVKPKPKRG